MSEVLHVVDGGVAQLTLNRPEALNAITPDQRERLVRLLGEASADPGVRAVVLTGTGGGLCAGAYRRVGTCWCAAGGRGGTQPAARRGR